MSPTPDAPSREARRAVSASIEVAATPAAVFAVLADPHQHADFDGSGTVQGVLDGPHALQLGDRFGMRMRWGLPYRIRNTVVEHEQDTRIAWRHLGGHRWRYELEPIESGTRVTETFDWSTSPFAAVLGRVGAPQRNLTSIEATLPRLKELVERS